MWYVLRHVTIRTMEFEMIDVNSTTVLTGFCQVLVLDVRSMRQTTAVTMIHG